MSTVTAVGAHHHTFSRTYSDADWTRIADVPEALVGAPVAVVIEPIALFLRCAICTIRSIAHESF
ncbi:MAG: hypothetical protein Q7S96_00110 [bacterium]|nr:hypothetical protein [bacterium]